MGVDISGKDPIIRSPKPSWPENWDNYTDEQKSEYFKILRQWEKENPGDYFRSNWWGWRPLVILSQVAMENAGLDYSMDGWGSNDGAGLNNSEECMNLANALEYILDTDDNLQNDDDVIYINLGSWVNAQGGFVSEEQSELLNEDWLIGEIRFTQVVGYNGNIYSPSHSAPVWHVKNWINFLKECGGFEIW